MILDRRLNIDYVFAYGWIDIHQNVFILVIDKETLMCIWIDSLLILNIVFKIFLEDRIINIAQK